MLSELYMKNQKGENLIELIIVVAVAIIVVTALVFSTISSLRNAQFAQNQSQATKLAQEWIEKLKISRDKDENVVKVDTTTLWDDLLDDNIPDLGGVYCFLIFKNGVVNLNGTCVSSLEAITPGLLNANTTESIENGRFKRYVLISNNGSNQNQKRFTVVVRWTDFSGAHESKLTTILGKI